MLFAGSGLLPWRKPVTERVTLIFDLIDAVRDEDGSWRYSNILPDDFRMVLPENWTLRSVLSRLRKMGMRIRPGSIVLDDSFSYDSTWELRCRANGKPLWAIHEMR